MRHGARDKGFQWKHRISAVRGIPEHSAHHRPNAAAVVSRQWGIRTKSRGISIWQHSLVDNL
jgi:hypothetical protein